MTQQQQSNGNQGQGGREPAFNLPPVILALAVLMLAVHLAQTFVLNEEGRLNLLIWFAYLPVRFIDQSGEAGGLWPLLWTPVTHAFLHAGWEHLIFNCAWLAIFGTPVARRYGPVPFLVIFLVSAIAGAALFTVVALGFGQSGLLLGASGGVAGLTGASLRFMFQPVVFGRHPETGEPVPLGRALGSLADIWRNTQARTFGIMWVVLNAAVPLLPLGGAQIAWHAHLGGFFAGLFLVKLFEGPGK